MRAVWILPLLGSLFAGFQFLDALLSPMSAPQQAAAAAMALCWAVPPYVFARAVEGLVSAWRKTQGAPGRDRRR
jgi:hypothetical protein